MILVVSSVIGTLPIEARSSKLEQRGRREHRRPSFFDVAFRSGAFRVHDVAEQFERLALELGQLDGLDRVEVAGASADRDARQVRGIVKSLKLAAYFMTLACVSFVAASFLCLDHQGATSTIGGRFLVGTFIVCQLSPRLATTR
jgi:hypothetical protein